MFEDIIPYLGFEIFGGVICLFAILSKVIVIQSRKKKEKRIIQVDGKIVNLDIQYYDDNHYYFYKCNTTVEYEYEGIKTAVIPRYSGFDIGESVKCVYDPKNDELDFDKEYVMHYDEYKDSPIKNILIFWGVYAVVIFLIVYVIKHNMSDILYPIFVILFLVGFAYGIYNTFKSNKDKVATRLNDIVVDAEVKAIRAWKESTDDGYRTETRNYFTFYYEGAKRSYYGGQTDALVTLKIGDKVLLYIDPKDKSAYVVKKED